MTTEPNSLIVQLDKQGAVNARLLRLEVRVDYTRVEAASLRFTSCLSSPEGKRLFLRYFTSAQLQLNYLSNVALKVAGPERVDPVLAELRAAIERFHRKLNSSIDAAEDYFKRRGITRFATYEGPPLEVEVPILSALGRRYYEAIVKYDQFMPLLQTLLIHEVITDAQAAMTLSRQRSHNKMIVGLARSRARTLREEIGRIEKPRFPNEARREGAGGSRPSETQRRSVPTGGHIHAPVPGQHVNEVRESPTHTHVNTPTVVLAPSETATSGSAVPIPESRVNSNRKKPKKTALPDAPPDSSPLTTPVFSFTNSDQTLVGSELAALSLPPANTSTAASGAAAVNGDHLALQLDGGTDTPCEATRDCHEINGVATTVLPGTSSAVDKTNV